MFKLSQILPLLHRDGVDQVILQDGSAPHVRMGEKLRSISSQVTDRTALEQLLLDAGISDCLPTAQQQGAKRVPFSTGQRNYYADVLLYKGRLQIRFDVGRTTASTNTPNSGRSERSHPSSAIDGTNKSDHSLESILSKARQLGASDVHISAGYPALFRTAGKLKEIGAPIADKQVTSMLTMLLDEKQKDSLKTVGYADLALELPRVGRLRVNVSRQQGGLKGCFRLIFAEPASLESLGLPLEFKKIVLHHQGLVVVSGPNGSGKTTTMASLINLFNESRPIHIITVEDPVEIVHPPKKAVISQREVGRHTRTFQAALKGSLREDPDIIAIGELRDQETVEMALSAAETGHLVIATMNTPSGAVTIDRLIDMFPQGVQSQVRNTLAGTLKMIISQRLVPSKDGKTQYVAAELISGCVPLSAMIRDNKLFQLPSLLQQGKAYGIIRIEDSINALVRKGLVETSVARAFANDTKAISSIIPNAVSEDPLVKKQPPGKFNMKQFTHKLRGK